jgi:hypothetical protein
MASSGARNRQSVTRRTLSIAIHDSHDDVILYRTIHQSERSKELFVDVG